MLQKRKTMFVNYLKLAEFNFNYKSQNDIPPKISQINVFFKTYHLVLRFTLVLPVEIK